MHVLVYFCRVFCVLGAWNLIQVNLLGRGRRGDVYERTMGSNFVLGIYVQGVAFKLIYLNILRVDSNNCFEGCKLITRHEEMDKNVSFIPIYLTISMRLRRIVSRIRQRINFSLISFAIVSKILNHSMVRPTGFNWQKWLDQSPTRISFQ